MARVRVPNHDGRPFPALWQPSQKVQGRKIKKFKIEILYSFIERKKNFVTIETTIGFKRLDKTTPPIFDD